MTITAKRIPAAFFGLMLLAACASHDSKQQVAINTVPPGASCDVDREGIPAGHVDSTPGSISLEPERDGLTIACSKHGFFKTMAFVKSETANSLSNSGTGIGEAIGSLTGKGWHYAAPVTITLLKMPGGGE